LSLLSSLCPFSSVTTFAESFHRPMGEGAERERICWEFVGVCEQKGMLKRQYVDQYSCSGVRV
jgi:hypothetical protein